MTGTRIVLAAALFVGASSAAIADCWDTNLANRYPGYAARARRRKRSVMIRLVSNRAAASPCLGGRAPSPSARRGPASELRLETRRND